MVSDVGSRRDSIRERGKICYTAHYLNLVLFPQIFSKGDKVYSLILFIQFQHGKEYPSVRLFVKITGINNLDSLIEGTIFYEYCTENGLFSLNILRRYFVCCIFYISCKCPHISLYVILEWFSVIKHQIPA